ncbi:hypothetical protein [Halomonas koreensis]|uniref:Uncharacterized protein n=1 Tax=Halomonas koreensis TaxID=245385 RepID=A0ABU1G0T1_9GAMM|nr:hypothetical protein [Halomonas koreensis]MDR5866546.1 hypothetical protein [Halomonas koreensis]
MEDNQATTAAGLGDVHRHITDCQDIVQRIIHRPAPAATRSPADTMKPFNRKRG